MNGLRKNERCPIHKSFFCCGREGANRSGTKAWQRAKRIDFNARSTRKGWKQIAAGVWEITDEHHSRGFRHRRSPSAMRVLVKQKVEEQHGCCAGPCGKPFQDIREAVPDHIEPRGMGGARRDDHPDNIRATCVDCNNDKGSKRI